MSEMHFNAPDGARLSYRRSGAGPIVLMLHGFLANAAVNWIRPGVVEAVVARGYCAVTPDLRGHGGSATETAFPPDVLAADQEALLAHLGVERFALVGYSLGARVATRMLARGARPVCAVLAGMGESVAAGGERRDFFVRALSGADASPAAEQVRAFLAATGAQAATAIEVLQSQIDTPPDVLAQLDTPVLALSGDRDFDNGSAERLAAMLPNARAQRVPGAHLSTPGAPEFHDALVNFLRDHLPS